MTNRRDLVDISKKCRKENGYIAIFCFAFAAFVSAAALFLSYFSFLLAIAVLPVLLFPIMFGFQRVIIALRDDTTLTFGLAFAGYRQYFTERFVSTYCFLRELWKVVVVYFATAFLASIVSFLCFYLTNFLSFYDMIKEVYDLPYITIESLEQLITDYYHTLMIYTIASNMPALIAASLFAFITYSINSVSFFLRMSALKYRGKYLKDIFIRFKRTHFKDFFKSYLYLNWPLIVLFLIGFGGGLYLGYLYNPEVNCMFAFGISIAFFLSFGIYGSFYFSNKESLYLNYVKELEKSANEIKREVTRFLQQLRLGEEEVEVVAKEMEEPDEEDDDYEE